MFSLWWTKNVASNQNGQFSYTCININFFFLFQLHYSLIAREVLVLKLTFFWAMQRVKLKRWYFVYAETKKYNNHLLFSCWLSLLSWTELLWQSYLCFFERSYSLEAIYLAENGQVKESFCLPFLSSFTRLRSPNSELTLRIWITYMSKHIFYKAKSFVGKVVDMLLACHNVSQIP